MDLKKLFKKLGFSENFFYSARKVFSGFSLGVGASLLLTVLFLNNPFKASTFHPVSQSSLGPWPFSFSSTGEQSVQEKTHQGSVSERSGNFSLDEKIHSGNFSDKGNNTSFWDSSGREGVIDRTHGGNISENVKNGSFFGLQGRVGAGNSKSETSIGGVDGLLLNTHKNGSLVGKSGEFADKVPEGNNMANVSSNGESVRSIVGEEGVAGGTKEVKPVQVHSNGTLIGTSVGFADMGTENNNTHNVLGNEKSGEPVGRGGNITGSTQEAKPVESDKNETFTGKTGGFAGMGTERNNTGSVSSKGESVKSTSVPEKIHEGNSSQVNKFGNPSNESQVGDYNLDKCDIFDGRWVRDEGKPYYPAGSCPHIDRDFDCHLNGRPDNDFLKWRWQPNHCDIPSLNATDFLERLRGKKLIFVGDSLNRNMWESLVCILRHSVADKKKVYEISGRKEFKKKGFYGFRYEEYNCSVDFVSAPFLVRESSVKTRNGSLETLRLDLMDRTTFTYHDADVIVFNTGHWWTHEKTSKGENYYQEGNHVYPTLKVLEAYMKALTTWARWIDKNIDAKRTHVIFRGYSETHFSGGQWNSGGQCHKETEPIFNDTYLAKYPSKMKVLEHVLEGMSTPVVYMNISRLTDYRKDAHPSIYRKEYKTVEEKIAAERSQDCSHWCLPGVPDTWNELLYASLLRLGIGS